jgi:HAD superfamily hydrolase (TIGR01549 family)
MKKEPRRAIKALLLDAGGTIVFPNFWRIAKELARDGIQADPEALMRAEAKVRFELDRHEIILADTDSQRWNQYLKSLFDAVGVDVSKIPAATLRRLKEYQDQHNLWDFVPDDIPEALDILGARLRLGVVSNANGTVRKLLTRLGLAGRFEAIVDSFEEKIEKPDPRIFQIALDRMRLSASETAYVGDLYNVDVVGARKAGLYPFLLDPLGLYADKRVTRVESLRDIAKYCW